MTESDLQLLVNSLLKGDPPDPSLAVSAGSALQSYLLGTVDSLDDAFGVRRKPGQRRKSTIKALCRRNQLIRQLWTEQFPRLSRTAAARQIYLLLVRYEAGRYRFDIRSSPPPERQHLFDILSTGNLPGIRRLITILNETNEAQFISQDTVSNISKDSLKPEADNLNLEIEHETNRH